MAAVVPAGSTSFSFIDRFKNAFVSSFSGAGVNLRCYQFGHFLSFLYMLLAIKNRSDDAGAHAAVEAHALASGQAWVKDYHAEVS